MTAVIDTVSVVEDVITRLADAQVRRAHALMWAVATQVATAAAFQKAYVFGGRALDPRATVKAITHCLLLTDRDADAAARRLVVDIAATGGVDCSEFIVLLAAAMEGGWDERSARCRALASPLDYTSTDSLNAILLTRPTYNAFGRLVEGLIKQTGVFEATIREQILGEPLAVQSGWVVVDGPPTPGDIALSRRASGEGAHVELVINAPLAPRGTVPTSGLRGGSLIGTLLTDTTDLIRCYRMAPVLPE